MKKWNYKGKKKPPVGFYFIKGDKVNTICHYDGYFISFLLDEVGSHERIIDGVLYGPIKFPKELREVKSDGVD